MFTFLTNNLLILFLALFSLAATYTSTEKIPGYDLNSPDASFILPDILLEISGVTSIDANTFACVQDENGVIFFYDIVKNEIRDQYRFNIDGDYEGIARVTNSLYILRSDGVLFEISDYRKKNFKLNTYTTGIPADNNEGLCYDPDKNRLLIACKSAVAKGPAYKDMRAIYGFDLKTKKLTKAPVFDFDIQVIKQFAQKNKIELATRTKKKGQITEPVIKFRTSAIAIHPFSKKLFLLSAVDHLLFIFSMEGKLEQIEKLDPYLFNKAEGITFLENGDLLITNEGQHKKPTLLRFKYRK
jgi:hypothetical protein